MGLQVVQKSGLGNQFGNFLGMLYGNKMVNEQSQDILKDSMGLHDANDKINQTEKDFSANPDFAKLNPDGSTNGAFYDLANYNPKSQQYIDSQNAVNGIMEAKKIWENAGATDEEKSGAMALAKLHRDTLDKMGIKGFGADASYAVSANNYTTFNKQNRDNFIHDSYVSSVDAGKKKRDDIINKKPRPIFGGALKFLGL